MKPAALTTALRRPLSARIKVRRSTVLMLVLFLGLGALWLTVKAPSASSSTANTKALNRVLNGLHPGESVTITGPPTTVHHVVVTTTTTTTAPATHPTTTLASPSSTKPPTNTTTTTFPTPTSTAAGKPTTVPPTVTTVPASSAPTR